MYGFFTSHLLVVADLGSWPRRECTTIHTKALATLVLLLAIAGTSGHPAQAADSAAGSFALRWENDVFGGTDQNYSNGIGLALTRPESGILGAIWNRADSSDGQLFTTWELTQLQFTPADLNRIDPDPNDRPYAGVLYVGLATHLRRERSLHTAKLILGVVGPSSFAERTQIVVHKLLNDPQPRGWDYQIKNESIVDLLYEYHRRLPLTAANVPLGADCIPMAGGMLGNYLTQVQTQVQCRAGVNLPDDFGGTTLRESGFLPPPRREPAWGGYLFAGAGGTLVLRDITLDGNTFAHSRSTEKRPLVPRGEAGAALTTPWCLITFGYQVWGKTYYHQKNREDFGSLLVSWRF